MELNREQIIKALECCGSKHHSDEKYECKHCPLNGHSFAEGSCYDEVLHDYALSLINELTEENERLRKRNITLEQKFVILEREEVPVLTLAIGEHDDPVGKPGECGLHKQCQADTVRKMQERMLREFAYLGAKDKFNKAFFFEGIDRIVKEIIEGETK